MALLLELSMPLAYDPSTAALTSPGAAPTVLPRGIQPSLAALCSELSRLVYVAFEADTVQAQRLLQDLNRAGIAAYTPICSAETGTQAFGVTLADGRALLVFRGTEPQALSDLGTDLSATPTPWRIDGAQVHQGFKRAFDSIDGAMTAWLAGRRGAPPPMRMTPERTAGCVKSGKILRRGEASANRQGTQRREPMPQTA